MTAEASCRLVLWTAPRRSGKTTALTELAVRAREAGIPTAGILAPAVHEAGELVGYDVTDVDTGRRCVLARRGADGTKQVGAFSFSAEGLAIGRAVLAQAASSAALVIVDEFGPLELAGSGWRESVDALIGNTSALIVLAVREGLSERVARLYGEQSPRIVPALEAGAIDRVLELARPRK